MKKGIDDLKKELVGEIKELATDIAKSHSYIGLLSNEIKFRSLYEKFINLKFLEKKQYGLEIFEPEIIPIDDDLEDIEKENLHNDSDPELNFTLKSTEQVNEQKIEPCADTKCETTDLEETDEELTHDSQQEYDKLSTPDFESDDIVYENEKIEIESNSPESDDIVEEINIEEEILNNDIEEDEAQKDEPYDENLVPNFEDKHDEDVNDDIKSDDYHNVDLEEIYNEKIIINDSLLDEIHDDNEKIIIDELSEKSHKPAHDFIKPLQLDLNDQLAFQYQLFDGDSESMNMVIRTLNALNSLSDSQTYLRDLKTEMEWADKEEYIERLEELVIKRFE